MLSVFPLEKAHRGIVRQIKSANVESRVDLGLCVVKCTLSHYFFEEIDW